MNIRKQAAAIGTAAAVGATAVTVALVTGVESSNATQSGTTATTTGQHGSASVAPSVAPSGGSGVDPTAGVGQPAQNSQPQGGSHGS